ncbi:SpvB/TcaC N-terminal domain-containing protein [Actinoplanes sp. NPDC026670]|uniref:SpvB/TcaC N-terminal domain-containing protein n=1 Tax=Actinoplanes sp. NPDC026670 TaxID=3154700 RepID=UPI0033D2416D
MLVLAATGLPGGSAPIPAPVAEGSPVSPASIPPVETCVSNGAAVRQAVQTMAGPTFQAVVTPGAAAAQAQTVEHDGARLTIGSQAVDSPVTIGVTPLTAADLPVLGAELTNVTGAARPGWRFTPHPYQFAEPVEVALPYDPRLLEGTFDPQDVHTFWFDDTAGCWKALERVRVDEKNHLIVSTTDHFTDMVNAVLALPESPRGTAFNPTQIKDLEAASPAQGINLVQPPVAAGTGEARLSYPIELPPGRAGLQPQLAVGYDSSAANGWLGLGWNLATSAITVDTRWGVPRYDTALETETYLLAGEQLGPVAHRGQRVARTAAKVFQPRVQTAFTRVIRNGTGPSNYSWETVDKEGTRSFYGGTAASTLRDDAGNIYQWALREVRDAHGNVMRFHTVIVEDTGIPDGGSVAGREIYLREITYTGTAAVEGPYAVRFIRDRELEEPRRGDVTIDARGGFKRVTADLLRRIEITLNDLPVRAYELEYTTGAFGKTLLASLTQLGSDNRVFHRHTFGYHDDIRDGAGDYRAFEAVAWTSPDDGLRNPAVAAIDSAGGQASAINASTSDSAGGHLYVGFGATRSKANSVGVKTGFNRTEDAGLLALADVDGDSLPDKVFTRGDGVVYRKNLSRPGGQPRFADTVTPLRNLPGFLGQSSNSSTIGLESYLGGVAAQLDHVDTFTTTERYLADVNADGISDVVNGGDVLFGRIGADGAPVYGLSSQTPVPIGSAPVDTDGIVGDLTTDREREIDSHPLVDTVRRWVAPYDGTVDVTGAVTLIQGQAEADGVRVAVQHEDTELWSAVLNPGAQVTPAPGAITVERGDRLYFRVQSRFDGADDEVTWDPRIAYTAVPETTDVNGLDPYTYTASADFTLGGRAGSVLAPVTGTLHLSGNLTKSAPTTDDVTAVITRAGQTVFSETIAAADTGEIPIDLDVPVTKGQEIGWRIQIDSPIDLTTVTWVPTAAYTDPALEIKAPYRVDMYSDDGLSAPQESWTAPADGTLSVAPTAESDERVVFTVKKRGVLLAKRDVTDGLTLEVPVAAGDELFFDFSTLGARPQSYAVQVGWTPGELSPAPSAVHSPIAEGAFAQPYRGWGVIGVNGNRDRAARPIVQADLVVDETYRDQLPETVDPQAQRDEFAADPRVTPPKAFPYTPDPGGNRWSADDRLWAGPGSAASSRLGTETIVVPTAGDLAAATAVPRTARSRQISLTGGVGGPVGSVGGSVATGDSSAITDFLDLNGDGFPDVVGGSGIQYTEPDGALGSRRATLPDRDVRRTSTVSGNANAGSAARSITTGYGDMAPPASDTANTAVSGNDMPPLGVGGNLGSGTSDTAFDLADINGDGLPDRVYADGRAALNLGYRFAAPEPWPGGVLNDGGTTNTGANIGFNTDFYGFAGGASYSVGHSSTGESLLDVTGDGLADRVFGGSPIRVAINTGSGFGEPVPFLGGPSGINDDANAQVGGGAYVTFSACFLIIAGCVITNPGVSVSSGIGRAEQALRDINGDGFADHLRSTSDDQLTVAQNTTGRTNLLKTVNRPLGSRIDLDYTRDGNTYDQPQSRFTLSRVAVYDGRPGDGQDTQVSTFRYAGGVYDRLERVFRGYTSVVSEQRDPAAGSSVQRTTTTEYATGSHYTRGLVTRTVVADAGGRLFVEAINSYQERAVAALVVFPQLVATTQNFFEGRAAAGKTTSSQMSYDDVGNLVRSFEAGEAGAADDVETKIRYTAEDTACKATGIVGAVKAVEVRGGGKLMRRTEATIDCATGDIRQHRAILADSAVAKTDLTYDAYGNVLTVVEPENEKGQRFKLTYTYDPALVTHVATVTDSFGYRSQTSHDLKFGRPETSVDTNGHSERRLYDEFGRVDSVTGPYETVSNHPTVDIEYHPEAVVPYAITRNVDRNPDGSIKTNAIETITFTDGLGRIVQTKKDATLGGAEAMTVSGRIVYDFAGRVVAQSYPVSEAKGVLNTRFSTRVDPVTPTRTDYDVLDRAVRTVLPDGAVTAVGYGFGADRAGVTQFETAVTDAKGVTSRTFTDVSLRASAVAQGGAWTSYGYDPLGQITTVTDDHGNTTTATYDDLGRRTSVTTPDTGRTRYTYDLAGNLTTKVTANLADRKKLIEYDYDHTRLTAVRYPTTPEADVTYTYGDPGAASNGAGRIVRQTDAAGTVTRGYGPLGETVTETRTVTSGLDKATAYTTRYEYDTWNRIQRMTYPDGEVLTYRYNHGGLVDGATGVKGGTSYPYLTKVDYDVFDQRVLLQNGNGTRTSYSYDATDRRLATLTAAQADGTTFQNQAYDYDSTGNVTSITGSAAPVGGLGGTGTQTFSYDDLNRLTGSAGTYRPASGLTDRYTLSLTYDSLGDITLKDQTHDLVTADAVATPQTPTSYRQAYAYDSDQPHAPSTAGPFTFKYDLNGNMIQRTGPNKAKLQLTYNDADQMTCSTGTGTSTAESGDDVELVADTGDRCKGGQGRSVEYVYDDQGDRVVKDGGSGNVSVYPSQTYTQRNKSAYKHIFVGDTRLVSKLVQPAGTAENGQFYFHTDHLGSTSYGTDSTGRVVEHARYLPSGESWAGERTTAIPSPYGFAGKELDTETGLHYFGARYYDARTALWQSPDPQLPGYLDGGPADGVGNPGNLAAYTYSSNNPVRITDPDGRWVHIAAGAALGALINTGVEGFQQYRAGEFSARKLIGAAAGGAVSGAIGSATLGTGLLAKGAVEVAAGAAEDIVTKAVNGESQNLGESVQAGLGGLVGPFKGSAKAAPPAGAVKKADLAQSAQPCHSFSPDTLVLTGDGTAVPIKELQAGDTVIVTDPLTGESSVRVIEQQHVNRDTGLTDLTLTGGAVIQTTEHHPFWSETRQAWVQAADLRPGERLRAADATTITVEAVRDHTGPRTMYDLTVSTVHAYYVFAGAIPVLVHNCDKFKNFEEYYNSNETRNNPGAKFASEYISPSGQKYWGQNAHGMKAEGELADALKQANHHGGCSEVHCLIQAYNKEGPAAISGGSMRTVHTRNNVNKNANTTMHGQPANPCGHCNQVLNDLGITRHQ